MTRIPTKMLSVLAVAIFFGLSNTPANAQSDIKSLLKNAEESISSGDWATAKLDLQDVLKMVTDRQIEALLSTFPAAENGWKVTSEASGENSNAMTGIMLSQEYQKGSSNAKAEMSLDNPMLGMLAGMFSNPMLLQQQGIDRVRMGRENAMLKWNADDRSGEITLLLGGRAMLKIEASGLSSKDELVALAKGWKIDDIKKISGI